MAETEYASGVDTPTAKERKSGLRTLVPIDGSDPANAALRVAAEFQGAGRIFPTLLSVHPQPFSIGTAMPSTAALMNALLGEDEEREWLRGVRAQVLDVCPEAVDWPIRVAYGDTAAAIDTTAVDEHADLVIMGLHRHSWIARASKLETTLEVVRKDHANVLAVVPQLDRLPRCIVVGTDFSQASARAAQFAARLLAPGGRLLLVYAETLLDYSAEDREGYGLIHNEGVHAAFARIRSSLELPAGATVETHEIDAVPRRALLDLAHHKGADLITVGRQHHSAVSLALIGSTATDLLRDAGVSVLVTHTAPWTPRSSTAA
jgi:nucleotide-binding universal stress UspA family protein